MQKIILLVLFVSFYLSSKSQWYDPEKVNHKAITIYTLAINKARNGDYASSVKMINEALKIEPKYVDAYLSLAGIDADLKNYTSSVSYFEKAFSLDSVYAKDFLLPYSISLAGCGRFNDALNAVNAFLSNPKLNERSIKSVEFRKKT
jgi:Tfp pilus assembly protein PilF